MAWFVITDYNNSTFQYHSHTLIFNYPDSMQVPDFSDDYFLTLEENLLKRMNGPL